LAEHGIQVAGFGRTIFRWRADLTPVFFMAAANARGRFDFSLSVAGFVEAAQ